MTLQVVGPALAVLLALVAGWLVPAVGMHMLWPSIRRSAPRATNYRGVPVATGLGSVWPIWVVSVAVTGAAVQAKTALWEAVAGPSLVDSGWYIALVTSRIQAIGAMVPLLLVAGSFAFGLMDDVYGDAEAKGFRGHLGALRTGRLTTGSVKMFGIGLLAVYASSEIATREAPALAGLAPTGPGAGATFLVAWIAATLVIALSANLVNLLDLRPGRALKGYSLIVALGVVFAAVRLAIDGRGAEEIGMFPVPTGPDSLPLLVFGAVAAGVMTLSLALGPVLAVWRLDLGERGMLGDAGANAAGALGGYLLAAALPVWGMVVAAAVLLALNLASEKVSFSQVIEGNAALRWVDGLGRIDTSGAGVVAGRGFDTGTNGDKRPTRDMGADTGKDG